MNLEAIAEKEQRKKSTLGDVEAKSRLSRTGSGSYFTTKKTSVINTNLFSPVSEPKGKCCVVEQ